MVTCRFPSGIKQRSSRPDHYGVDVAVERSDGAKARTWCCVIGHLYRFTGGHDPGAAGFRTCCLAICDQWLRRTATHLTSIVGPTRGPAVCVCAGLSVPLIRDLARP